MSARRFTVPLHGAFVLLTSTLGLLSYAAAQSLVPANDTVLHVFQGGSADGILPAGGVVFDSAGNLYGATIYGGSGGSDCIGGSCGTVYELTPPAQPGGAWVETILYNFTGVSHNQDGELPNGGLVIDAAGNLYGVTAYGGTGGCELFGGVDGCGTVFKLSPPSQPGGSWTKTTIYSFQGGLDGDLAMGSLTFDAAGNLYGATQYGGGFGTCNAPFYQNCGTIFELSPPKKQGGTWTERVLYSFKGGTDGANPNGGLIFDKYGALYGTTYYGGGISRTGQTTCEGNAGTGCGTVFRLEPPVASNAAWHEEVLYRFRNWPTDGALPSAGVVADEMGNLYGMTLAGGSNEEGAVFLLSPPGQQGGIWTETVILNLGGPVGAQPMAGFILRSGSLYGTGSSDGVYSAGTVFRLGQGAGGVGSYSVLCNFPAGNQVAEPESSLTFDKSGALYGTAQAYDHEINGAVFKVDN